MLEASSGVCSCSDDVEEVCHALRGGQSAVLGDMKGKVTEKASLPFEEALTAMTALVKQTE